MLPRPSPAFTFTAARGRAALRRDGGEIARDGDRGAARSACTRGRGSATSARAADLRRALATGAAVTGN
jgi:hypothetical protein